MTASGSRHSTKFFEHTDLCDTNFSSGFFHFQSRTHRLVKKHSVTRSVVRTSSRWSQSRFRKIKLCVCIIICALLGILSGFSRCLPSEDDIMFGCFRCYCHNLVVDILRGSLIQCEHAWGPNQRPNVERLFCGTRQAHGTQRVVQCEMRIKT